MPVTAAAPRKSTTLPYRPLTPGRTDHRFRGLCELGRMGSSDVGTEKYTIFRFRDARKARDEYNERRREQEERWNELDAGSQCCSDLNSVLVRNLPSSAQPISRMISRQETYTLKYDVYRKQYMHSKSYLWLPILGAYSGLVYLVSYMIL